MAVNAVTARFITMCVTLLFSHFIHIANDIIEGLQWMQTN